MKMYYYWLALLVALILYIFSTLHTRCEKVDNQLMQAWFIQLPGWSESYYPEQKVDLSNWAGSNIKNISIEENGVKNPELEAAASLKALGIYDNDYKEKLVDGHWILHRPEKTVKYFSFTANYRISGFTTYK